MYPRCSYVEPIREMLQAIHRGATVLGMATFDTETVSRERVAESRRQLQRAVARMVASSASMLRAQARLLLHFSGTAEGYLPDGWIVERIRQLVAVHGTNASAISYGPSRHPKNCDVCKREILKGAAEYDVCYDTLQLFMDRRCFSIMLN